MSEVVSFGNIINSLRAVRNDYNDHLKAVPQYEAFLLVESSTQSVADKLQGVAPAMAAEILEALETVKVKFREHLTSVPEYRALLAIDKLINDVKADLGVQAIIPRAVEAHSEPIAQDLDAASFPAHVVHTVAEQQADVRTEAAPMLDEQPDAVAQNVAEESPAPVHALSQAEAPAELSTTDAISQLQTALEADTEAPHVTPSVESGTNPSDGLAESLPMPSPVQEPAAPAQPHTEELAHGAEKAA